MKTKNVIGWIGVLLGTIAASCWAFWGVNEAFHEGWTWPTFGQRILQVFAYLGPALALTAMTAISIRWPRVGAALFVLLGGVVAGLIINSRADFHYSITISLTLIPVLVGLLFLIGRPSPTKIAFAISVGLPLVIIIGFGAEPVYRISQRFDDGDLGARVIAGNGVTLEWAPAGPGWTREGHAGWEEAICRVDFLNEEGTKLEEEPQYIWRLPTREEIVRSLTRGNINSGGTWDADQEQASYERRPDKESPVWDAHASLIYLWTSEDVSEDRAWIVVYHGGVFSKPKKVGSPSFGFRAVRNIPGDPNPHN